MRAKRKTKRKTKRNSSKIKYGGADINWRNPYNFLSGRVKIMFHYLLLYSKITAVGSALFKTMEATLYKILPSEYFSKLFEAGKLVSKDSISWIELKVRTKHIPAIIVVAALLICCYKYITYSKREEFLEKVSKYMDKNDIFIDEYYRKNRTKKTNRKINKKS